MPAVLKPVSGSFALLLAAMMMLGSIPAATAQQAASEPQRKCQTVRTCNFARGGSYRGCLSSYTCRICQFVTTRCHFAGHTRCQELRCTWGG